jgi:hypothetical protein
MEPVGLELLAAITDECQRFNAVARQVRDPSALLRNSSWTTADLVAHVATGFDAYVRYLEGDETPFVDISDLAGGSLTASNANLLAEDTERDIGVLTDRIAAGASALNAEAMKRSAHDLVAWHGRPEALRTFLATTLAEGLLHGRDLATSIGVPWTISKREATLVLENIAPLLPLLVNPATTRSLSAAIAIRLRGGATIPLAFDRGTLSVDPDAKRFDATISADPVAFLLVAYGRRSQWSEIALGRMLAWGRRPWLALKLKTYLVNP